MKQLKFDFEYTGWDSFSQRLDFNYLAWARHKTLFEALFARLSSYHRVIGIVNYIDEGYMDHFCREYVRYFEGVLIGPKTNIFHIDTGYDNVIISRAANVEYEVFRYANKIAKNMFIWELGTLSGSEWFRRIWQDFSNNWRRIEL